MRPVLLALLLAGCYGPRFDECKVRCGPGCPAETTCAGDGFCHAAGETQLCAPGAPDSAIPPDEGDAAPVDGMTPLDAPCEVELLTNGGFEATDTSGPSRVSPPWQPVGNILAQYVTSGEAGFLAHDGVWGVRMGGGDSMTQLLQQDFVVPSGARGLRLSFYFRTEGTEPLFLRDTVDFQLIEGATLLGQFTYVDGHVDRAAWTAEGGERIADFSGRQLSLRLALTNDLSVPTTFFFDDVSLRAVLCD